MRIWPVELLKRNLDFPSVSAATIAASVLTLLALQESANRQVGRVLSTTEGKLQLAKGSRCHPSRVQQIQDLSS